MYGWIWRHLPGPWPVRSFLSLVLVGLAVAALFSIVFPWAEHALPFINVTVDQ